MSDALLGLTLGLVAGAYMVTKSDKSRDFVKSAEKHIKKTVDKVNEKIK